MCIAANYKEEFALLLEQVQLYEQSRFKIRAFAYLDIIYIVTE